MLNQDFTKDVLLPEDLTIRIAALQAGATLASGEKYPSDNNALAYAKRFERYLKTGQ